MTLEVYYGKIVKYGHWKDIDKENGETYSGTCSTAVHPIKNTQ